MNATTTIDKPTPKVIVNGAFGRMGQITTKTINESKNFSLVGTLGHHDNLNAAIVEHQADIVIDFTHATTVYENALVIINAGARPVIGTSGLLPDQISKLQSICTEKKIGGIIAPNFSLGAVLLMKHAAEIARHFSAVEIIEMHHDGKLDSPSGTAIKSAEMIAKQLAQSPQNVNSPKPCHETLPGARGAQCQHIPIHAIRLPGLLAHESIIFGSTGETLTLRHDSISRECFMPGVLLACHKVMTLDSLIYGLENLLV